MTFSNTFLWMKMIVFWFNFHWSLFLLTMISLIARFMGPTWGPSGVDRTQVGPMLATWTLLSGLALIQVMASHWTGDKQLPDRVLIWSKTLHKIYSMQRILIHIKADLFVKCAHLHPGYAANLVARSRYYHCHWTELACRCNAQMLLSGEPDFFDCNKI